MKPLRKPRLTPTHHAPGTTGRRMPDTGNVREKWNEGGTLHAATFAEWHSRGTYEDGLATCADWVAATRDNYPRNTIRYKNGDELLHYAHNLLTAINIASASAVEAWPDGLMCELAMQAMTLMGWVLPDGVMPGQRGVDPVTQLEAEVRYLRQELEKMKEEAAHVGSPA